MIQSLVAVLILITLAVFYYDIRRRANAHQKAIQKEKSDIATMSHMTATMSTFSDGKTTESLLAASEDSELFFYRLIVKGQIVMRYTLALPNVFNAELLINGSRRVFHYPTSHKTATMRATDISQQARRDFSADEYDFIRDITLNIHFRSEDGKKKSLPVRVFRDPAPQLRPILPKILENAIWWQQFLTMQSTSPIVEDDANPPLLGTATQ